jgi:diguanylate cyclase (GGDEF)-like protein/PAS domain S-box-containing protein
MPLHAIFAIPQGSHQYRDVRTNPSPLMTLVTQPFRGELQALLDASPDAVLVVDRTGVITALNQRTAALFGTTAGQLLGQPVEALLPERLRASHAAARAAYSRAPTVRRMSARSGLMARRADGTEFPVEVSLTPILGSVAGLVMAVVQDISPRTRVEEAPTGSDRAAAALEALADPVLTTDAAGKVDFLNRSAEELTGWTREAAWGRSLAEILPLADEAGDRPLEIPLDECIRTGQPGRPCEGFLVPGAGRAKRALELSTRPIHDRAGAIAGATVVARDVTHARLLARQLSHQATHDALTGLVNRNEFERRLARAFASAGAEHTEHALCFLDLDGFKRVNDACGHLAGDELLRQLSTLMRERMRARDTLARLGGDEFGILLEHCRLPRAARIAEGIRRAIGAHRFGCAGRTYAVGVSIGITPIRAGAQEPVDLLQAADAACYLAKRRGGNRVQLHDA